MLANQPTKHARTKNAKTRPLHWFTIADMGGVRSGVGQCLPACLPALISFCTVGQQAISVNELAVWCHGCNKYIDTHVQELQPFIRLYEALKFGHKVRSWLLPTRCFVREYLQLDAVVPTVRMVSHLFSLCCFARMPPPLPTSPCLMLSVVFKAPTPKVDDDAPCTHAGNVSWQRVLLSLT